MFKIFSLSTHFVLADVLKLFEALNLSDKLQASPDKQCLFSRRGDHFQLESSFNLEFNDYYKAQVDAQITIPIVLMISGNISDPYQDIQLDICIGTSIIRDHSSGKVSLEDRFMAIMDPSGRDRSAVDLNTVAEFIKGLDGRLLAVRSSSLRRSG